VQLAVVLLLVSVIRKAVGANGAATSVSDIRISVIGIAVKTTNGVGSSESAPSYLFTVITLITMLDAQSAARSPQLC
jgi:hypothetical protein